MENPEFRKRCKILSFKWTLCISSRIDFLGKQRTRRLIVHAPAQQKKKKKKKKKKRSALSIVFVGAMVTWETYENILFGLIFSCTNIT